MEYWEISAWLSWIFPLLGALLTPIAAKINSKLRDYLAVFFSMLAAISTITLLPLLFTENKWPLHKSYTWIRLDTPILSDLKVGVLVDPLSIIMANIVAIISFLIMVYSLDYMHGDPGLTRYWFFMNFFIGNMLLLVLSENLIQMLFGWEGVGLCSYALIGFWYRDSKKDWLKCWVGEGDEAYPPSHCGLKAFIVTRLGDVFMLVGTFIILSILGTLSFTEMAELVPPENLTWLIVIGLILIFVGPIGKSAQLPLMEWLPDAMAGPTTVSALIHAATMVKAGVYLVARLFPIVYSWSLHDSQISMFFNVVLWIGTLTALVAALQAVVATELKKVLAYSTVSQLGYMMMALGAGGLSQEYVIGYTGGVFHVMSHAMFKAALFLSAGIVIHAVESRFLRDYGGLRKYMPHTFKLMLLATFSLMGVPILFSGFWSKDMILEAAYVSGQYIPYFLGVFTAALTAFYSLRMIGLTFFGEKSKHIEHLEREGRHIHEASYIMLIPVAILVIGTVALGITGFYVKDFLEEVFHRYLSIYVHVHHFNPPNSENAVLITLASSIIALTVGAYISYITYLAGKIDPKAVISRSSLLSDLHRFLFRRCYLNRLYYIVVNAVTAGSNIILKRFELGVIDKANYATVSAVVDLSREFRKTHTGILNYNVIGIILGILLLVVLLVGFGC